MAKKKNNVRDYLQERARNYQPGRTTSSQDNSTRSYLQERARNYQPTESALTVKPRSEKQTWQGRSVKTGSQPIKRQTYTPTTSNKANKITELSNWAKKVRTSESISDLKDARTKAAEYKDYFRQNQGSYDRATLNQVKQLLTLTDREISRKEVADLEKKQLTGEHKYKGPQEYTSEMDWQRRLMQQYREQQGQKAFEDKVKQDSFDQKTAEYEAIRNNPDFAEKSVRKNFYDPSRALGMTRVGNPIMQSDDVLYEYVNRNPRTIREAEEQGYLNDAGRLGYTQRYAGTNNSRDSIIKDTGDKTLAERLFNNTPLDFINDIKSAAYLNKNFAGLGDQRALQEMDDDEVRTFNYIDATQGRDKAVEYLHHIMPQLTERQRGRLTEQAQSFAEEQPVLSSLATVADSPLKGLSYLGQAADYVANGKIDQNASYNQLAYMPTAVRDKVSDKVAEKWGEAGSFLYNTGMSMADMLVGMGVSGGSESLMLGIMGAGAAADKVIESKDRGLSDAQSFAIGTIAGGAEVLTEKISLDVLLDSIGKGTFKSLAKNLLTEGSEEVGADLINLLADVAIAKDKGEWKENVQKYIDQGYSEAEAFGLAVGDQAMKMGISFLSGAVMGGTFGGAVAIPAIGNATADYFRRSAESTVNYDTQTAQGRTATPEALQQEQTAKEIRDDVKRQQAYENMTEDEKERYEDLREQLGEEEAQNYLIHLYEQKQKAEQERMGEEIAQNLSQPTGAENLQKAAEEMANPEAKKEAEPQEEELPEDIRQNSRMGDQGKQALNAARKTILAYSANMNPRKADKFSAQAENVFSRAYSEGMAGKRMTIPNRFGSDPMNLFASMAYDAGINDGRMQLIEETANTTDEDRIQPLRSGSGIIYFKQKDAGIVNTIEAQAYKEKYGEDNFNRWNSAYKALGIRVNINEHLEQNGFYNQKTGEVSISMDADLGKAFNFYAGHEFTHRMRDLAPKEFERFRDAVAKFKKKEWQTSLDDYRAKYEAYNANLKQRLDNGEITQEQYDNELLDVDGTDYEEEIVADFVGDLMEKNSTVLDDFLRQHLGTKEGRTIIQRLRDFARSIVRRLKGNEQSKIYRDFEKKLSNLLNASYAESMRMLDEGGTPVEVSDNAAYAEDIGQSPNPYSEVKHSVKETNPETVKFLENQKHITTYKAMQMIDGKLYPPMAARVKGKDGRYQLTNPSELGVWQRAVEDLGNAKFKANGQAYYVLDKADGTQIEAAYNPYEHSSNLVLNDQFESAHRRPNLVVVECEIPVSEMGGTYKADHAKDATGMLDWKSGVVAGQLKDNSRKVYLSRWLKPVRILPTAEVAQMWSDTLKGQDVSVPFNVVSPDLLTELENHGVKINYSGSPMYQAAQKRKAQKNTVKNAVRETDDLVKSSTLDELLADLVAQNLAEEKNSTKKTRRVDEVNKKLKKIGLQFNGTDTVAWTDERIDKYLGGGYYASSDPNYAQAHIAYMSPQQFIGLTVGGKVDTLDRIEREASEYGDVDYKVLGDSVPIYLMIDKKKTGAKVVGHEGRHRMFMLGKAGVKQVPVLIFDSADKYSKTTLNNYTLQAQTFGQKELVSKGRNVTVDEMIPFSQGNRELIKEKFGSGNKEASVRYSVRSTDSDYMKAVENGDMETAQKMVDEAAKKAGYLPYARYHGTPDKFTIFDAERNGSHSKHYTALLGTFFTTSKDVAKVFSDGTDNVVNAYLKDGNYKEFYSSSTSNSLFGSGGTDSFSLLENDIVQFARKNIDNYDVKEGYINLLNSKNRKDFFEKYPKYDSDLRRTTNKIVRDYVAHLKEEGYDGIRVKSTLVDALGVESTKIHNPPSLFITFSPEQIKSADPVTYDDKGNVIPLSERFNSENKDIRYSVREDTDGKALTKGQQEFYKNSKAVDKDGRLLKLYHGTGSAGFTVFRPGMIWMTTSRRDADSYGGNWEKKLFDPNEKETATDVKAGNYNLGEINDYLKDYHFDSQEDLDNFVKAHPGIENVADEDTLDERNYNDEITDAEYYELSKLRDNIRKDYSQYNLKHSTSMTIGDVLDNPSRFDKWSLEQAFYAFDRNADIYDDDTAESLGEALQNIAEEHTEEEGEEWLEDFRSISFMSRVPAGEDGQYIQKTDRRTYPLYANVQNPLIVDAHHGYMSDGYYDYVDQAVNGDYDGAIIRNVRVGRYKDVGDVVIAFDSNQVKLVTNENPTEDKDIRYAIRSTFESAGFEAERKDGIISLKYDGKAVTEVTPEHIKNSGLGAIIQLARDSKNISKKEYNAQINAAAELMNMILKTQDPDLIWEWAGAGMFSAIKSNSDGQYGTTVDFTTICRKTQEMVTAMSEAMKEKKRGLTKDEVAELQKKVYESGATVPCPVCYVFSRWAGVGAILDGINKWQQDYKDYTPKQIQKAIEKLEAMDAKDKKAMIAEDESYIALQEEIEKLTSWNSEQKKTLKKLQEENPELAKICEDTIAKNEERIKKLKAEGSKMVSRMSAELAWLKNVRANPKWTEAEIVPPEILFDLDAAETFAEKYPLTWKYRTTRGPSAGKAILPYSDMRLGDMISGPGKGGTFGKVRNGQFNKAQKGKITRAMARTRAQNIIGGQRFQSTSDYRAEYGLDYLQVFWEAQALGSNMQTYTKVVEFADIVAAVGGDCNLSVMGKGKGFVGDADKLTYDPKTGMYSNGTLQYSSVTGMDVDAAIKASKQHDSVQLILVGINDAHVRLALNDEVDDDGNSVTGGSEVGFVIPWHASGNADAFIAELVKNLGESYTKSNYQDYSKVQEDHNDPNATEDQIRRRELRKALLTAKKSVEVNGKKRTRQWTPSAEDLEFIKGTSKDISHRSFEDLLETERKALAGDKAALKDYESWSAGILWDLYQNMWQDKTNDLYWYTNPLNDKRLPVRLNGSQAGSVMPHEYWNQTVGRDKAYINGFIFRSYCHNLGLLPRFTGNASDGKVNFGDFSDCAGYWKTLIDRPMYDNNGKYRAQKKINVSELKMEMLSDDYAKTNWEEYYTPVPNKARAKDVGQQYAAELTARENNGIKHSIRGTTNILDHAETVSDTAQLYEQIKDLQKELDGLKGEFKSNKGYRASVPEASKAVKRLINRYEVNPAQAGLNTQTLTQQFIDWANKMAREPEKNYAEVRAEATKLAYDLIWNSKELVETDYSIQEAKDILRKTKIYVDSRTRSDIGDFEYVRKEYFGRLNITYDANKGQAIDDLYSELSNMYGWLFPDDIQGPSDQFERIMEVEEMFPYLELDRYSEYDADTVELATNEILTEVLNAVGVKNPDTYRDKMEKRIKAVRKQRDQKIENLKEHQRQQKQKAKARRQNSQLRKDLLKAGKRLEGLKTTGMNREVIKELLGFFDTTSGTITGKTLQHLSDVSNWVEEQVNADGDYIIDEITRKKLVRLAKIQNQINEYHEQYGGPTFEEVLATGKGWDQIAEAAKYKGLTPLDYMTELLDTFKALEAQTRNEKHTIDTEDRRDIFIQGVDSVGAIDNSYGINSAAAKLIDKWIFTETARPRTEMLRICGYNEDAPLFQRFEDVLQGQRNMVDYKRRANVKYFDRFFNDKQFQKEVYGKHAREIEITGMNSKLETIKLKVTPDLLMSLYMHSLHDQNSRHMQEGGVMVPDIKLYKAGKIADAYEKGTKITLSRTAVKSLAMNSLTQKEKEFIHNAQRYYKEMSQKEINEVSEKLLGYSLARVDNYFHIVTDKHWLRGNLEGLKRDGTLEGMGYLKERINAKNPMQLVGMIRQVTTDIANHSRYVGLAIPIRNFLKVYEVSTPGYEASVKDSIRQKWGDAGNHYIEKLMADIQNPKHSTDYTYAPFLSKVRSRYAQAVLTLNASVAIKQSASYPTAAAELGWGPLAKALATAPKVKGKSAEFIAEYSPLMRLRTEGYVSQETGDILASGKKLPKLANWIQAVDIATVRTLWLASEYNVRAEHPELKYGTREFYEEVGRVHTRVIENTQPNYTELQRSQILRSDSELIRMLNMFKTQPFQNFNILLEGFGNYRAKKIAYHNNPTDATLADFKKAKQKLARAVTSQIAAAFVFAAMQWLWDIFRGKADKYSDEEGENTFMAWFSRMGLNMASSVAGSIPFGQMYLEFAENATDKIATTLGGEAVFDQKFYGLDAGSSLEKINDLFTGSEGAVGSFIGLLSEVFNSSEADSKINWEQYGRDIFNSAADITEYFGIPVGNIKNTLLGAVTTVMRFGSGDYIGQYWNMRIGSGITSTNKKQYYELLLRAYEHKDDVIPMYGGSQFDVLYDLMTNDDAFATEYKSAKENVDAKIEDRLQAHEIAERGIAEETWNEVKGITGQKKLEEAFNRLNLPMDQREYIWNWRKEKSDWKKTYKEFLDAQKKSKALPMNTDRPFSRMLHANYTKSAPVTKREKVDVLPQNRTLAYASRYAMEMDRILAANPDYEFPETIKEFRGELEEMGIRTKSINLEDFYNRAKDTYDRYIELTR